LYAWDSSDTADDCCEPDDGTTHSLGAHSLKLHDHKEHPVFVENIKGRMIANRSIKTNEVLIFTSY